MTIDENHLERSFRKEIEDKKILLTGGTGSFGKYILPFLLKYNPQQIIIFSRDEDKQHHMRREFASADNIRFTIGDVRDLLRIKEVSRNVDTVIHAAALKQVPYCEEYPPEAILTNVIGARNIQIVCIENKVEKAIGISTDKAVKPVNVMGMTKSLQERIFTASPADYTKFACVRYGNVIGSRGSVIPLFLDRIHEGKKLPITHPDMTRFLITLRYAINLVFLALIQMKGGEVFVRKCPSCRIIQLGKVMYKEFNPEQARTLKNDYFIEMGIRPGEKIHEVLVSEDEARQRAEDKGHYYVIHPYWENKHYGIPSEYCSFPPTITDDGQLIKILKSADNLTWNIL